MGAKNDTGWEMSGEEQKKWRQATCNMTGIEGEHNANTEGLSDSLNSL